MSDNGYGTNGSKFRRSLRKIGIGAVAVVLGGLLIVFLVVPAVRGLIDAGQEVIDFGTGVKNEHFCDPKVAVETEDGQRLYNGREIETTDGRQVIVIEHDGGLTETYEETERGIRHTTALHGRTQTTDLLSDARMPEVVKDCKS